MVLRIFLRMRTVPVLFCSGKYSIIIVTVENGLKFVENPVENVENLCRCWKILKNQLKTLWKQWKNNDLYPL